jgi:hypothetical protein
MNTSRSERYRPIKAEEIAAWYGTFLKPVLSAEQFDAIAKAINGWWWPGDEPPADASPETEAASRKYMEEAIYLWDFKQVTKAAKTLLDKLPAIQRQRTKLVPHDYVGLGALEQLSILLTETMPMIEFPWGPGDTREGRPHISKLWQSYALLIGQTIIPEMSKAGHETTSISRNSVIVRIVREVMMRMKIEGAHVTETAISAFLVRWDKFYGLTPQGVETLMTTNETRNFFALVAQSEPVIFRSRSCRGASGETNETP